MEEPPTRGDHVRPTSRRSVRHFCGGQIMTDQPISGDPTPAAPESSAPAPTASTRRVSSVPRRLTSAGSNNCPVCNSSMVLRKARRGPRAGTTFWSCSRYPGCRGMRDASAGTSPSRSRSRGRRGRSRKLTVLFSVIPVVLLVPVGGAFLLKDAPPVAATSPLLSSPTVTTSSTPTVAAPQGGTQQPIDLVLAEDGERLYTANLLGGNVTVLDTNSMEVVDTIDVPGKPISLALAGSTLYVADNAGAQVYAVDRKSGKTIQTFTTGAAPADLAVDSASDRLFVAHEDGSVQAFSAESGRRLADPGFASTKSIALDSDEHKVYVNDSLGTLHIYRSSTYRANTEQDDEATYIGTGAITLDTKNQLLYVSRGPRLRERNLETRKSRLIDLPIDAQAVAVDPARDRAFVADPDTDQVRSVSLG